MPTSNLHQQEPVLSPDCLIKFMAPRRMEILMSVFLAVTLSLAALVQSDCNNVLSSLSPCKDYIIGSSSTPSSGCCTQLSSVVDSQPQCLCQIFTGGGYINLTRALALPKACHVETPPASLCNNPSKGTPSGPSPAGTPGSPAAASGGESQDGDASHGSSIKLPHFLLFCLPAIAISASFSATT